MRQNIKTILVRPFNKFNRIISRDPFIYSSDQFTLKILIVVLEKLRYWYAACPISDSDIICSTV